DAARRHDAAIPGSRRLPDGQRKYGLRAVGADGRDEGRARQRGKDHQGTAAHLQQDAAGGDHEGTLGNRWWSRCSMSTNLDPFDSAITNQVMGSLIVGGAAAV